MMCANTERLWLLVTECTPLHHRESAPSHGDAAEDVAVVEFDIMQQRRA